MVRESINKSLVAEFTGISKIDNLSVPTTNISILAGDNEKVKPLLESLQKITTIKDNVLFNLATFFNELLFLDIEKINIIMYLEDKTEVVGKKYRFNIKIKNISRPTVSCSPMYNSMTNPNDPTDDKDRMIDVNLSSITDNDRSNSYSSSRYMYSHKDTFLLTDMIFIDIVNTLVNKKLAVEIISKLNHMSIATLKELDSDERYKDLTKFSKLGINILLDK